MPDDCKYKLGVLLQGKLIGAMELNVLPPWGVDRMEEVGQQVEDLITKCVKLTEEVERWRALPEEVREREIQLADAACLQHTVRILKAISEDVSDDQTSEKDSDVAS